MKKSAPSDVEIVNDLLLQALQQGGDAELELLHEALKLADHHCSNVHRDRTVWKHQRITIYLRLAEAAERRTEIEQAFNYASAARSSLTPESPTDVALPSHVMFSRLLMTRGVMDKALEVFHEARALAIDVKDGPTRAVIDANIATILFNTRHFDEAQQWFLNAADQFRSMGEPAKQAHAMRGAGMTLSKNGLYPEALKVYAQAIEVLNGANAMDARERISIEESMGVDHLNLADVTQQQHHYQKALQHFRTELELSEQRNDAIHRAVALRNIAQVMAEDNYEGFDLQGACSLFEEALQLAASGSVKLLQAQILRQLSKTYERLGKTAEALHAFRDFYDCERDVISEQADAKIRALEIRNAVEKAEAEVQRQQLRTKELEAELEQQRSRVTSTSLAIGHKNAALREARNQLREVSPSSENISTVLRNVVVQLELAEHNEEYWDGLEEQLSAVHQSALQQLSQLHPTLTPTERRVCALIRHNLSTKDIARLLSAEPRTVEKYRQRIRKKLGLKDSDNLNNYLSTL